MSQNNMISFITLTDLNGEALEVNPSGILIMQRKTSHDFVPYTKLTLSFNVRVDVIQTPEQIAQLQMDAVAKVMESVMTSTYGIFEELEDQQS